MLCNRFSSVTTLVCLFLLGGRPGHASAAVESEPSTLDPVPAELTSEPDSDGYIQPTCSKCQDLEVERQESEAGETQGVLGLTYFDEDYGEFEGSLEVTVTLRDATEDVLLVEDVWLSEGDEGQWILEARQEWSWEDVEMVKLELVPAE